MTTNTHGGRRAGAGRKPHLAPEERKIRRSVMLSPEADLLIRAAAGADESYSAALDRLIRALCRDGG